jgi:hypothetical protein
MKESAKQIAMVIICVLTLYSLMGFAHPAADEPKQYMIIRADGGLSSKLQQALTENVNAKIAEGWRPQGGLAQTNGGLMQAMVK